jgi:hypothetical protein
MVHNQATNFRNLAAQFVLGRIALAIVSSLITLSGTSVENDRT